MTTPAYQKDFISDFDKTFFNQRVNALIKPAIDRFKRALKSFALFNFSFISLIIFEIIYFCIHLTFFVQTFVLAIHLALIFATIFCFFTIRMYACTKKAENLIRLKFDFLLACKHAAQLSEEIPELHKMVAEACCDFASELHGTEYQIYKSPAWCSFLSPSIEKINCFLFWNDVHFLKELLLQACIDEHIKLVKIEPTDLEGHAGLANAYVMLSGLYVDPRTVEGLDDDRWIPPNKFNDTFRLKFRLIAERAIEEFKILCDYAPHDPWVHAQLAYSYHDLQMPKEEIKEYEILIELCPEDKETLFKLGRLYFEQGENAKGLQVYENLKDSNYKKAECLIHFYGAYEVPAYNTLS